MRIALAGRKCDVKQKVVVLGVMVLGIALMLWAGWHNLRERRLAMQKVQENRVELIPQKAGKAGGGTTAVGDEMPSLRGKVAPGFTLTTLDG